MFAGQYNSNQGFTYELESSILSRNNHKTVLLCVIGQVFSFSYFQPRVIIADNFNYLLILNHLLLVTYKN